MTSRNSTFVNWLVERLYAAGTRRLFGVPGGGTSLDLIDAATRQGMEMVLTAREDAAVIMAGVSGVLTEAPGLAFATKGPGLASAANGLASASLDRMPALLVAETFGPGELDYVSHQAYDQPALVAPLLRNGSADVLDATVEAVEGWLRAGPQPGRHPAVMFPPADALKAAVDIDLGGSQDRETAPLAEDDLVAAKEMLTASINPVVIVGLEAARPAVAPLVGRLVETLNAPVLCTYMAAGTVPVNHSNYAGIFTGGAIEQLCVNEADLIVLIGLDPVELIRKPWPYAVPVLDLCETVHRPHYLAPETRLCALLEDSLPALIGDGALPLTNSCWTAARIAAHRERFYDGLQVEAENGLSSGAVVKAVVASFDDVPRLSVDAGAHMFSACAFWPSKKPRDVLISNGLATMGFAVPAALAAALHEPARGAVAMTGDGGLMMCLGELKTMAQLNANVCVVVFNDGCLSLIDIKRQERQMQDLGLAWDRPDFSAIARGFGFTTWRPTSLRELETGCAEAATQTGPRLIDAQIDPSGYLMQMKSLRG